MEYVIKNQRGASKKTRQAFCVPKSLVDELFHYGIRVLAEQLLGTVLDIKVDHTAYQEQPLGKPSDCKNKIKS